MEQMKNMLLKKNIETFSKILSKFLNNETLTWENYYPAYCLFVTELKQNFWELKIILSDNAFLNENLKLMLTKVKKKKKEYDQDFRNTKLTFEKDHFVSILNYLEKKQQNQQVIFRKIYIQFFTTLYDEIYDYFNEKKRFKAMLLLYEKNKK